MEKPCEWCGTTFRYKPSHAERRKCCSKSCAAKNREARADAGGKGTRFQPGLTPWSKTHAKGRHLSPQSEFKPGHTPANKVAVGTVRIRDDKNGAPRAWVKVAEPNRWRLRSVVNWEAANGPVPRGTVIHHRDRDSLNDELGNLTPLTPSEHATEHAADLIASRGHDASSRLRKSKSVGVALDASNSR